MTLIRLLMLVPHGTPHGKARKHALDVSAEEEG